MKNERYILETDEVEVVSIEQPLPVLCEENSFIHSVDRSGCIVHDERYPDETCPCHEDEVSS